MIPIIALFSIVAVVAAIIVTSSMSWKTTVKLALVIVVTEGILRKWVLPQATEIIYFLKDLVLTIGYIKYYLSSDPKYPLRSNFFNITLLTLFAWCVIQVFTPGLGSPLLGLFGLKAYFLYIPLMWLLPSLFESVEDLHEFLRNFLLLVIPVAILAIVQYFSPRDSPLNIYAGTVAGKTSVAIVGENARVTGTFPYITGYSSYLCICFTMLMPLLSLPHIKIWRWLLLLEIALVIGTSFMSGARSLVSFELLFVLGYFSISWLAKPAKALRKFVLPIVLMSAVIPYLFSQAIAGFTSRATTGSDSNSFLERVFSAFGEPLDAMQWKGGFDSYGIGATHPGVAVLRSLLNIGGQIVPPSEGEMGRLVLEIGIIGFLLWYGIRLMLIFSLFKVFLKLETPFLSSLALSVFLLHLINLTTQLVFNNTFGIYYWFLSGFIFLLPELEYRQLYAYQNQSE
jgi:hypothetical protein